mmetsp:Transcript_50463/g.51353  ORF Transcript_50463/g.51353 Transcript_50463/m.51353 type:complete len:93 (+) Transcript_50463:234-512(+)
MAATIIITTTNTTTDKDDTITTTTTTNFGDKVESDGDGEMVVNTNGITMVLIVLLVEWVFIIGMMMVVNGNGNPQSTAPFSTSSPPAFQPRN